MRGVRPERALDAVLRRALRPAAGSRIVVACSGGPDSVALAAALARLSRAGGFTVVLGFVDHGRRLSAAQDECVALSVAARLECAIRVARPAAAGDDEAGLRTARYAALGELARALEAPVVVTAHTAEDQTETVLLALFRGAGLDGLAGIPVRRPLVPGIELVRPALRLTHAELGLELRRSGLPYALDPTNAERRYRRNALRGPLAELRAEFPQLDRAVARCAEIARDQRDGEPRAGLRRLLRGRLRSAGITPSFAELEARIDAGES